MSETRSPLARLVLFMFCLSVAGTFIAGVHYAAIDLPVQNSLKAPTNEYNPFALDACNKECNRLYWVGTWDGVYWNTVCKSACLDKYLN